jgi:RNA polymerase primary sigma factor
VQGTISTAAYVLSGWSCMPPPIQRHLLNRLLQKAEESGYISLQNLRDLTPVDSASNERLKEIAELLRRQGVIVVEDEQEYQDLFSEFTNTTTHETEEILEHVPSGDSVSIYLREMSSVPLLTYEEETDLAKRIENAFLANLELAHTNLKADGPNSLELELQVRDGLQARDYLIRANTRLVVSIARRYTGRGVPFLDLIQEGNLGLMKAVEKYDYRRGFRFSTYATWWIRQGISRSIADQGRTIRVPVHMTDRIRQMNKITQQLEQKLGRPPSIDELAKSMELDPSKVKWIQQVAQIPLSLESPVGDDEDSELGMFIEDEHTPGPAQITYQNMLRERLEEVLGTLPPREARIVRLRFGLGHDRAYTLEEVGQKFGLTRERIRQIESKALRRLRHPTCARLLRDYI